jgi:hypothetical protein
MRSHHVLLLAVSLAPACASESNEMLPVSTTAAGSSSTATSSVDAKRRDNGFVRFVQAIPDVSTVDVYANDMRIFTSASYGTVTPYRELGETDYTFRIRPAGQEMAVPMAVGEEDVDAGRHYTVIAIKKSGSTDSEMKLFDDDLVPPKAGAANLRIINASPDAGELDLYTPGAEKPLFSGVDFEESTDYETIKPMVGRLTVRREDEKAALIELPITSFDAGKIYTVIVFGWAGAVPPAPRAIVVEDRFGAP